ncbi:MAG: hypothetical protein GY855_15335, partial [candidate division Zixibacteria bacterium]|nr:hypothetical protein [candidate division Zixibacteria bacterium]
MKIRGLIISLSLLFLYALNACAQTDDKKIYIFHSKVGKVIEVEEWRLYRIFPYLENFHSAKLFIDPDGNTTLELLREENGELKSTKQTVKKDEIARLRAIVNYLNPSEERSPLLILPKLEDNSQLFFGHKDFELFSPKPYALHELHRTGFPVQVLGGTIASAGLGWGLFYVIANTGRDAPTLGSFVVGGFLGSLTSIFAAPLGVRIASIGSHPHGSYWIGVVGSIVGTGATI